MMRTETRGFALLEAIVALAILAAAGLALFAALSSAQQMLGRADDANRRLEAKRNMLAVADTINPMQTPVGHVQLGDYSMQWKSTLLEPVQPSATGTLAAGLHDVGLYRVECELTLRGKPVSAIVVRRVGYQQVRELPEL